MPPSPSPVSEPNVLVVNVSKRFLYLSSHLDLYDWFDHLLSGNSFIPDEVAFQKSPLFCLSSFCCIKYFSYLTDANFSNPKTGHCASTNQNCHKYP